MQQYRIMKMTFLLYLALLVFSNSCFAQHFVMMTDEERIELALDMIRKGVQQQDTTKILTVLASEISVKGKVSQSKADVAKPARSKDPVGTEHTRRSLCV
jgi:hypothetical protein